MTCWELVMPKQDHDLYTLMVLHFDLGRGLGFTKKKDELIHTDLKSVERISLGYTIETL